MKKTEEIVNDAPYKPPVVDNVGLKSSRDSESGL